MAKLCSTLYTGDCHTDRNFACWCCSISLKMPMAFSHKSKVFPVYWVPLSIENVLMGFDFGNDSWILASRQGRLWVRFMYLQFSTKLWISFNLFVFIKISNTKMQKIQWGKLFYIKWAFLQSHFKCRNRIFQVPKNSYVALAQPTYCK